MKLLLDEYHQVKVKRLEYLIDFYVQFEHIRPFQDGNGRVGRLIVLKECLRFGLVPFIIEDSKKMYYYRGLSEWDRERGYLTDTCLNGQDAFKRLMSMFDVRF